MNHTKRKLCALLLALSLALAAGGCTPQKPEEPLGGREEILEEDSPIDPEDAGLDVEEPLDEVPPVEAPEGFTQQSILFPVGDFEKTEYNEAIFAVNPFPVDFLLPEGWTTRVSEDNETENTPHLLYVGAWSRVDILDEEGRAVGCIGYNLYEPYEGEEDNPAAIYNQIGLGNGYQFDVREAYTPVEGSAFHAALTDVCYSGAFLEGLGQEGERTNRGILAYDGERHLYVAIEFVSGALTEEQLTVIAASLRFSPDWVDSVPQE
ncbi:MAG: hypothetical protein HFJ86_10960 [Oscillospiraceae bacterium]|nr:hypothetical protein [Oscillospiraceae bacterium]